jgi:nicotinamide-nucleotide amidase
MGTTGAHTPHAIETAEVLAVGSELLVGDTRDTNSGDLAASLTAQGVEVLRSSQLPDRQPVVVGALREAIARADLVVTTGGLGPTPDDLTREAIAEVLARPLVVDPVLEAWLRGLWSRRGIPFSDTNLKQAWLVPGAEALPNPNGTAPGWWVEHEGGVIVALPGPPRELAPMWADHVMPRLAVRGVGLDRAVETLHLTGIGESALVDVIGPEPLHAENPRVATYARVDAVDVRVSATGDATHAARELLEMALGELWPRLSRYVYARGEEGWLEALGRRLAGRRVSLVESGTAGQLTALVAGAAWLAEARHLPPGSPVLRRDGHLLEPDVVALASEARGSADVEIGLAVAARDAGDDMHADIAVDVGGVVSRSTQTVFRGGDIGRRRAATAACTQLWRSLNPAE